MTITINAVIDNDDLPSVEDIASQILNIPGFLAWFQADSAHVNVVGSDIQTFRNKSGGAGALTAFSGARRATLENSALGQYQAARFRGADEAPGAEDMYTLSGVSLSFNSPYTIAAVFKRSQANGVGTYYDGILGRYTSGTDQASLTVANAGSITAFRNNQYVLTSCRDQDWNFAICGWSGTNLQLFANGSTFTPVASPGIVTDGTIYAGALNTNVSTTMDGYIADIWIFQLDLFADADGLAVLKSYASQIYGL